MSVRDCSSSSPCQPPARTRGVAGRKRQCRLDEVLLFIIQLDEEKRCKATRWSGSYKTRGNEKENFCRNEYNVTGLCNRSSCPLANSQYATILEDQGKLSLLMKTVERAHTPATLWEKIELDANYSLALEQVSKTLRHWPKFLVHKNKQRLTKLVQFLIRSRRLSKHVKQDIVTIPSRELKREQRNELKAEKAAKLQSSIERELLERLSSGTYNSAYNFVTSAYDQELHRASLWSEQQTPSKRKRSTRSHKEIEFEVENDLDKL